LACAIFYSRLIKAFREAALIQKRLIEPGNLPAQKKAGLIDQTNKRICRLFCRGGAN
jgi:hypothetical protein